MKPGDLVITVLTEEEKNDPMRDPRDEFYDSIGLHGIIVEPVTLEDGHPINSWCDWWVMVEGKLEPWAENNLRLVNEGVHEYDVDKENE